MKNSSTDAAPPKSNVQTAWGCLTTNLAVPGFGSMLGGRRISGMIQFLAAITALGLQVIFFVRFLTWYIANRTQLNDAFLDDPGAAMGELWTAARWIVIGFLLFGFAWLWALLTSLSILRRARKTEAASKPAPPPL